MEFCSKLCGSQDENGVWGRMDTCIYMAECLHCSSETIPILLIGDTPIQNLKLKTHTQIACIPVVDSCQWMAKPIQYCKVK